MKDRIASWMIAAVFLASGAAKLAALEFELEAFARWGYPLWFMYLTGTLEVLGALGMLVRRIAPLAAACLGALMIGAVSTHIANAEWPMTGVAGVILVLCVWRAWRGRAELATMLSAIRG